MPTNTEWQELSDNCTWARIDNYNGTGVSGNLAVSKIASYTDKSIFIPDAGYMDGTNLHDTGSYGSYWSSSLHATYPFGAWYAYFYSGLVYGYRGNRYCGFSVRPVSESE